MSADEELSLMRTRLADLEKQLTDAHVRIRTLEDNCWLRKKFCGEPCSTKPEAEPAVKTIRFGTIRPAGGS